MPIQGIPSGIYRASPRACTPVQPHWEVLPPLCTQRVCLGSFHWQRTRMAHKRPVFGRRPSDCLGFSPTLLRPRPCVSRRSLPYKVPPPINFPGLPLLSPPDTPRVHSLLLFLYQKTAQYTESSSHSPSETCFPIFQHSTTPKPSRWPHHVCSVPGATTTPPPPPRHTSVPRVTSPR